MNDFREWLSDNLRYIMLGFGIIIIIVVIFFGVRFVASVAGKKGNQNEKPKVTSEKDLPQENSKLQEESQKLEEEKAKEQTNVKEITSLLEAYYKALGDKDVKTIRASVDTLDPEDEKKILNSQYIQTYSDVSVLVKNSKEENAYVGYVSYKIKLKNIDTLYPALNQNYIRKNEQGAWYIVGTPYSEDVVAQIQEVNQEQEVADLIVKVSEEEQQAKDSDAALSNFLKELGITSSNAIKAENGSIIKTKDGCKLREEPDTQAKSLETLSAGEEVKKVGVSGEWVEVEYNDLRGFIRADLLE